MNLLPLKNCFPPQIHLFFVYDTSEPDQLPFFVHHYCVFDHHINSSGEFIRNAFYSHIRPRSVNVLNLYDLVDELPEDVLFCFAVALVSETAFLRTACSEDLVYLSKFLTAHVLEDIFELILEGRVKDQEGFLRRLSKIQIVDDCVRVGIIECEDDDEFLCAADVAMYPLSLSVLIGRMPWGVWVYCKKKLVQKVFAALGQFKKRRVGRIYETRDVETVLRVILEKFKNS